MPLENVAQRSATMRAVPSKLTTPELAVRKLLTAIGCCSAVNVEKLPGKPDIVIDPLKIAIFVNGCFWHGHSCKRGDRIPVTNRDYWIKKISGNVARDKRNKVELSKLGWKVFIIWECQVKDLIRLERRIKRWLRRCSNATSKFNEHSVVTDSGSNQTETFQNTGAIQTNVSY